MNAHSGHCAKFPIALECSYRRPAKGIWSMASNRSDPGVTYPRLHIEMRRLSDVAILVDGWLIENAKGSGRSVLNYCGSIDEARDQISKCASTYAAKSHNED